jgi:hypothetical protein
MPRASSENRIGLHLGVYGVYRMGGDAMVGIYISLVLALMIKRVSCMSLF